MSDVQQIQTEEVKDVVITEAANAFDDNSWTEVKPELKIEPVKIETPITEQKVEPTKIENTVDYNSFVKEKFGYDSVEVAEQEFKKLKEAKPEDVKYKSFEELVGEKEEEVATYILNKKQLERLSKGEVTIGTAEEIIKLGLKSKYNTLSDSEIDFEFKDQFSYPEKPEQETEETDDEFQSRVSKWEKKVESVNQKIVIEAKKFIPELDKLKSELVFPNIQKEVVSNAPTQEELDKADKLRTTYEQTLESDYSKFNGFSVTVKNDDVEVQVPFVISNEERDALKKDFLDFNVNDYFGSRWFAEDGKPKVTDMMADKYFLENRDRIIQKAANEAVTQFKEKYIKARGNISLNKGDEGTFTPDNADEKHKQEDALWNA